MPKIKKKILLGTVVFFILMLYFSTFHVNGQDWIPERTVKFHNGTDLIINIPNSRKGHKNTLTQFHMNMKDIVNVPIIDVGYGENKHWRLIDWLNAANVYCVQHGRIINSDYTWPIKTGAFWHFSKDSSYISNLTDYKFGTGIEHASSNFVEGQWLSYLFSANITEPKGWEKGDYKQHDIQNILWDKNFKNIMDSAYNAGIWAGTGTIDSEAAEHPSTEFEIFHETNSFLDYKKAYKEPKNNTGKIAVSEGEEYYTIGPINIQYSSKQYKGKYFGGMIEGKGSNIKLYDKSGNEISPQYYDLVDANGNQINIPNSETNFYIQVSTQAVNDGIFSNIGKITFKFRDMNAYSEAYLLYNPAAPDLCQFFIILKEAGRNYSEKDLDIGINIDIEVKGNLEIRKYSTGNNTPMKNIGFKIYNKDKKKYVIDGSPIKYGDENLATIFKTDANGKIYIKGLWKGNYQVIETSIGNNDGYVVDPTPHDVQINGNQTISIDIYNKKKYVDISGYVWEDLAKEDKQTTRNNIYDKDDELIPNIPVYLMKKGNNEPIRETETDLNGKYIFKNVEIDNIPNYYISFKYNGMSYECVTKNLGDKNGSKATEGLEREKFNNKFAEIKKGEAIGTNNEKTSIEYDKDEKKYQSIINLGKMETNGKKPYYGVYEKYTIESNTYNAYNGYLNTIITPDEIRKNDIKEISNINLGLFLREQPNASLIKDLNNVKVSIKGQTHTYNYRERFNNTKVYTDNKELKDLQPQIKFQGKYSEMTYTRPLYASDIAYQGTDELTMKVIYEIGIINKTTNLKMKITELYDYFDSKYELKTIGRKLDKNGNVIDDTSIKGTQISEQNNYKQIQISTNLTIEPQKEEKIYIELEVSKDKVEHILDGSKNIKLDNIAEIGRYGTLDSEGKVYAGIDENSEPGNTNPLNPNTYEDDTDKAPGLSLILQKNARKVTGKVFLDNIETSKDSTTVMTGEERKGNGQYDNGEKGIKEVEVKLVYADNPDEVAKIYDEEAKTLTKDAIVKTNSDGEFEISGFIPEKYELKYTWGNKEYKVQEYKGTVIEEGIWNKNEQNNEWYKTTEPRYSDVVDDYETRKKIDNQTKKIINANTKTINNYIEGSKLILENGTKETMITKMDSKTQDFKVNIEYSNENSNVKDEFEKNLDGSLKLDAEGNLVSKDEFKNTIKNIDFGIVERPKQQISLEKHIKQLKITLSNGEILVNAKVEKGPNGEYQLAEKIPYTVYLPRTNTKEGAIKIEIDQELIEGAKLDVIYEITIKNASELDYISEGYYKFGNPKDNPVTLKANIIDYLDESLIITDKVTADKWEKLSLKDKKDLLENGTLDKDLQEYVEKLKSVQTHINEKTLKATEETKVELISSRLLSKNDEIILSNKTEIIEIDKTGGRPPIPIPGNFDPSTNEPKEPDGDTSEEIIIIPPTGLSKNKMLYIILGISTLGILTSGIILIKRFVLRK